MSFGAAGRGGGNQRQGEQLGEAVPRGLLVHPRKLGLELGVGRAGRLVGLQDVRDVLLQRVGQRALHEHQAERGVGDLPHVHQRFRLLIPHELHGIPRGGTPDIAPHSSKHIHRVRPHEPIREPSYDLDTLVNGITKKNRHDTVETGPPMGREIW